MSWHVSVTRRDPPSSSSQLGSTNANVLTHFASSTQAASSPAAASLEAGDASMRGRASNPAGHPAIAATYWSWSRNRLSPMKHFLGMGAGSEWHCHENT